MNNKKNTRELFFYISYTIILFEAMFNNVNIFQKFFAYFDLTFIFVSILLILIQGRKYKKSTFISIVLTLGLLILNYYFTKDTVLIKLYFLIITFKDIEFDNLIKYDLSIKVLFLFVVIIFYKVGLASNIIIDRADGTVRQSLGFSHPNALGSYIMSIGFEYIYVKYTKYNKFKIGNLFILIILFLLANFYTDSRTATIAIVLFLTFSITNKRTKNNKYINIIIPYLPYLFCAISFILSYNYDNANWINELDLILSKRIMYGNLFLKEYGGSLFGQNILTISTIQSRALNVAPQILDNSYIFLYLKNGFLLFIIFMITLSKSLELVVHDSSKNNKNILLNILLIYSICGMLENWLFKFNFNIFLLYFSSYLYKYHKEENVEKRE